MRGEVEKAATQHPSPAVTVVTAAAAGIDTQLKAKESTSHARTGGQQNTFKLRLVHCNPNRKTEYPAYSHIATAAAILHLQAILWIGGKQLWPQA